jgi:hypothetical protein
MAAHECGLAQMKNAGIAAGADLVLHGHSAFSFCWLPLMFVSYSD